MSARAPRSRLAPAGGFQAGQPAFQPTRECRSTRAPLGFSGAKGATVVDQFSHLYAANKMFVVKDGGIQLKGKVFDLPNIIFGNHNTFCKQEKNKLGFARNLRFIEQDLWNIATLIERLEWMRNAGDSIEHINNTWHRYAKLDIEFFHVEMRSAMDYAANAIGYAVGMAGKFPGSFRKLQERIHENNYNIPEEVKNLISNAVWFRDIRNVRDDLVHKEANSMIFGNRYEGILFQVTKNETRNIISNPSLMFNPQVVRFEYYAAHYFCHLIVFLESVFSALSSQWRFEQSFEATVYDIPGFVILHRWIQALIEKCKT